jgi:hypothetical protein
MKRIYLFLVTLLLLNSTIFAQKVAITGFNTDNADGFAFVALTNLTASTVIYFTDGPYVAASNSFNVSATNDVVLSYEVPAGGLTEGTVIRVVENQGTGNQNTFTLTRSGGVLPTGTLDRVTTGGSTGNFQLQGGEPLWAFSASNDLSPNTSVTDFFGGVLMGGPLTGVGDNPLTDPDAPRSPEFWTVIFTNTAVDGANFNTAARTNTTLATFVNTTFVSGSNFTNWSAVGGGGTQNITLSTLAFTNPAFGGGVFPVELIDFHAEADGPKVQLFWITASELNNDYFAVERSLDATTFEEIGQEMGAGTTQDIREYQFTDANPVARTLYYRLRQVDFDGTFTYSDVLQVEGVQVEASMKLYPNPIANELHVDNVKGTLKLYTLAGQLLRQYELASYENVIDVSTLDRGYYVALIVDENGNQLSRKIVK